MVERHQDYQISFPTIPPGGLQNLSIPLDSDAPFLARLVRSRGLFPGRFMFQNARRQWQSNTFRTDLVAPQVAASPAVFTASRGMPVSPQMIYPASSQIVIDVSNPTSTPITGAKLLFRGSKLYRDGAVRSFAYPPVFDPLSYVFTKVVQNVAPVQQLTNLQFEMQSNYDFVYMAGVCDPFDIANPSPTYPAGCFSELYVMLKDEARQPYSNEPIHVNDLFGQGLPTSTPIFSAGTTTQSNLDDAVVQYPGLVTPAIYLPRNTSMYLDVFRNDAGMGFTNVNLHFRLVGIQVRPSGGGK